MRRHTRRAVVVSNCGGSFFYAVRRRRRSRDRHRDERIGQLLGQDGGLVFDVVCRRSARKHYHQTFKKGNINEDMHRLLVLKTTEGLDEISSLENESYTHPRHYETKEESICFACERVTSFPRRIIPEPFSARCQPRVQTNAFSRQHTVLERIRAAAVAGSLEQFH
ncbi:hypothetical protein GHT06_017181 [Daphnia sinensis]|uniref:Uncharacterized protein n=1 Tax=Daphnia sinensis TaxID=1820382 RepID=A0AAD5PTL7_9CRUS|nr:hypothetical protein GHT06_017181 [Daphnia sinensis]